MGEKEKKKDTEKREQRLTIISLILQSPFRFFIDIIRGLTAYAHHVRAL